MLQTDRMVRHGLHSLDVYRVSLEFYRRISGLGLVGHAARHLSDAAESTVLNIAEAHRAKGADRARKFCIAADEASECTAALDLLEIRGAIPQSALSMLRGLLDREHARLYRLVRKR